MYKSGLIYTLLYRSYAICTNWHQIDTEIQKIKSFMLKNGYPSELLDRMVTLFLNKIRAPPSVPLVDTENNVKCYQIILPYLGSFSKRVEKKIKHGLQQHMPNIKINVIYRASTRLRTLFAFKDKLPSYLNSGIVYQFTCGRCNSAYIGETIRHSKTRFCEHMGVSPLTGKAMANPRPSAITDHLKNCRYTIKLDDFKIIGRDLTSESNLEVKESLFIHRHKPNINIQGSSVPLLLFKN